MKPLVGICSDLVVSKKDKKPKSVIDCGYVDGIYAAGGIPVVIPPMEREEVLEEYMERLDGLLMTGGLDLNPVKLGKRPHPSIKPMLPRREESDRRLLKMAIERKMPTLCVGVSMQLMNVMFGGSLHTHLPEDEAIELMDPSWWMVGVQWHPENDSSSALDRQLFEGFIDACLGKASVPLTIPVLKKAG